jgi:hypothetical protein
MIVAVSIMSAAQSAPKTINPLFLKVFNEHIDNLFISQMLFCSLDIFDERENSIKATGQAAKTADNFLGTLMYSNEYKLSGYIACSGVRFAVVIDDSDSKDELSMKSFMKKVLSLYTDCISNPFYEAGEYLSSPKFDESISDLVKMWNLDSFK